MEVIKEKGTGKLLRHQSLGTDAAEKADWRMEIYLPYEDINFVLHTVQKRKVFSHVFLELFGVCQLYVNMLF